MARKGNQSEEEVKIPPAVLKALEAVVNASIKREVGDFKATFKGEFIQLSDRVDELGEQLGDGKRGESRLLLTQKMYSTNSKEILEVSRIPSMASEPFAYALALDDKTSRRGQDKGVSLTALVIDYILRLNLSARGWNRGMSMPALVEQVGAMQAEEGHIAEIEAGGSR